MASSDGPGLQPDSSWDDWNALRSFASDERGGWAAADCDRRGALCPALAAGCGKRYSFAVSKYRESPAQRFQSALALFEFSLSVMRQRLRRKNPTASEDELERLLEAWVHDRPGAPGGDGPGRVRPWPRS